MLSKNIRKFCGKHGNVMVNLEICLGKDKLKKEIKPSIFNIEKYTEGIP